MREAHDEGFEILSDEGVPSAGVLLHCYNLDKETLKPWLDLGCYVAFGGPLTFKNADEVRASAVSVPTDHLLTETDSPYMTPEPHAGGWSVVLNIPFLRLKKWLKFWRIQMM